MLVFQALLLAGYIYSHVISVRFSAIGQARIHFVLLSMAFLIVLALSLRWPSAITPGASWKPQPGGDPTREVIAIIVVARAFLFLFSPPPHRCCSGVCASRRGAGTYKLYSVSNVGSLLGLLTFPFFSNPSFDSRPRAGYGPSCFAVSLPDVEYVRGKSETLRKKHMRRKACPARRRNAHRRAGMGDVVSSGGMPFGAAISHHQLLCQEVTTVPLLWVLRLHSIF